MSEWQPIETAPIGPFDKENWFIESFRCLGAVPGRFMGEVSYGYTKTGRGRWRNAYGNHCEPTHWMPSPEPPPVQS